MHTNFMLVTEPIDPDNPDVVCRGRAEFILN